MKSRKLPMEKRQNPKELSVTHTKRRQGLFNKAAELSLLCDSQIAVLVNSLNKAKVYSFGHSSVSSVISAFLHNSVPIPVAAVDSVAQSNLLNETPADSPADAFSVLDEFGKSESVEELEELVEGLEKLVEKAKEKGSPKFNCATSNCDQFSDPLGFDFCLNNFDAEFNTDELLASNEILLASNNGDELMAFVQQSASLSESKNCSIGNYEIGESSRGTSEEPTKSRSFTSDCDFLNANSYQDTQIQYVDCVIGESSGSETEEAKNWSFTGNDNFYDQFLFANNNEQDANIPYIDYWPSLAF